MNATPTNSLFTIPGWVSEHPELKARKIELEIVFKPHIAWRSPFKPDDVPHYVVKIVKEFSQEAEIYDQLKQYSRASPNHTVPCDVIRNESQLPLLIMPCVSHYDDQIFSDWNITQVVDYFRQIVEGLEFLHDHRIVHLDLRFDNLVLTQRWDVEYHKDLELGKVYIIDFSESRQLPLGPRQQPPIDLPQSIIPKPLDMQRFDPYSFDVYCIGRVLDATLTLVYSSRPKPWVLQRYAKWLIGAERGCTGVCRCRPTARRARQIIVALQWAVRGLTLLANAVHSIRSLLSRRKPPA
ncbi:hypothetical protein OH76DRAFT_1406924 [Lentinus brumalis]|uniref:Protein kinase domain-containing protein n=1 Tax=Lentinus brumalis TaxID=2498619 RepID=A0A371D1J8_9APHY|nr:hypothetical protein OH76DRAFT_1406924 [Polyporus brumalis]